MGQASPVGALSVVPHHRATCCTLQRNGLCFKWSCFWLPTHPPFGKSQGWVAPALAGLKGTLHDQMHRQNFDPGVPVAQNPFP